MASEKANGLTANGREHDQAEALAGAQRPRKICTEIQERSPGIRTNSASMKFEGIVRKFVDSFDSLAATKKARERFIAKLANVHV